MRRILATLLGVSLVGAALLLASSSWNGFTLTAEAHTNGGGAYLDYPALSSNESCSLSVTVYYQDGSKGTDQNSKTGPSSSGTISAGNGSGGQKLVDRVEASATCVYGGQTQGLSDTDYP